MILLTDVCDQIKNHDTLSQVARLSLCMWVYFICTELQMSQHAFMGEFGNFVVLINLFFFVDPCYNNLVKTQWNIDIDRVKHIW